MMIPHKMEINITLRCDLQCAWCNREMDIQQYGNSNVTPWQAEDFCKELVRANLYLKRLKVSGGEPTVNKYFRQVIDVLATQIGSRITTIVIQTRGHHNELLRNLPPGVRVKQSSMRVRPHLPFFVSPYDLGHTAIYGSERRCMAQRRCGTSWCAYGFMPCPIYDIIAHKSGYTGQIYFQRWQYIADKAVCQHCITSIENDPAMKLRDMAAQGVIQHPTPSLRYPRPRHIRPRWSYAG